MLESSRSSPGSCVATERLTRTYRRSRVRSCRHSELPRFTKTEKHSSTTRPSMRWQKHGRALCAPTATVAVQTIRKQKKVLRQSSVCAVKISGHGALRFTALPVHTSRPLSLLSSLSFSLSLLLSSSSPPLSSFLLHVFSLFLSLSLSHSSLSHSLLSLQRLGRVGCQGRPGCEGCTNTNTVQFSPRAVRTQRPQKIHRRLGCVTWSIEI